MSFFMPKKARPFFKTIKEHVSPGVRYLLFDSYYVCALLGLRDRRLGSADDLEGSNFLDAYPDDYRAQADFIAGLLIDAELERNGIDLASKAGVEQSMVLLLDPASSTGLSGAGMSLLNRYAVGGFERIEDEMLGPARLEDLLVAYGDMWRTEPRSDEEHPRDG